MKYLSIILVVVLYSCGENKRDFFQSLNAENSFLDTFPLFNLKGFGISNKLTMKNGRGYYDFNSSHNSIYIEGAFRAEGNKLFFLPKDSEIEILFLDSHWKTASQITPQKIITKNKDFYEVKWLGLGYNNILKDSSFNIEINGDGVFSHPESLTFEINKRFDILTIEHINCKGDTLSIELYPRQAVYFKHIDSSTVCL